MNQKKSIERKRSEPSKHELFTGGKDPEFAVFFNVAFTKLLRTIHHWKTGRIEFDENKLDEAYNPTIDTFRNGTVSEDWPDEIYSKLRNYIWKGYKTDRNSSGYSLDKKDKTTIRQLIYKLRALRNFHSHVYHDNAEITFNRDLKDFIETLHNEALYAFAAKHPEEIGFYQENFAKHPLFKEGRITQEGRTFFLSLFLTTGEVSRLLQQRRGSKKNDELRFRIKHFIYRYYAHRDGAARKYYNLEESLHDSLTPALLDDVMNAQKFYKINALVNDVPEFMHRTDLFPLYYQDENEAFVQCDTVLDLETFCRQHNLCPSIRFYPVMQKNEEVEKTGVICLGIPQDYTFSFELRKSDFHKFILDLIRLGEANLIQRLEFFLAERKTLIHALDQTAPEQHLGLVGDTPVTLADYEKYKLRGSRRLKELFVEWLMAYENKHIKAAKFKEDLLYKLETAPIELRHFDLYHEADQKPRTGNRFLEWCVNYLIDFQITPNWYWAFESFQTVYKKDKSGQKDKAVLRKVIRYFAQHPTDGTWRLCVDSDHILVKLSDAPEDQIFSIGELAMRNLLITNLDRKGNADFIQKLLPQITQDLNTLKNVIAEKGTCDLGNLNLLDRSTLPESLLMAAGDPDARLKAADWQRKTKNRLQHIIKTLEDINHDNTHLGRADKNEQVMRCYQFFDWDPKFLRQKEYQQLSIFHYSLERISYLKDLEKAPRHVKKSLPPREINRQLNYYDALIKEIKQEKTNRIPDEVNEVLRRADSLDDLLERIIRTTLSTLRKWLNIMETGSLPDRLEIARRLKIRTGAANTTTALSLFSVPFSIHPILVIKAYYSKEDKAIQQLVLSRKVRNNTTLMDALRRENHDIGAYCEKLAAWPGNIAKNIRKKLIGAQVDSLTHDAILWQIAGKYFEKTSPNIKMILTGSRNIALPAKVGSLRQSVLNIPVSLPNGKAVQVELFFHQLDDTLFVESKNMLTRVVSYIFRRKAENPEKYAEVQEDRLPYGEIVKEMARIQQDALVIAKHLLEWEKQVESALTDNQRAQYATDGPLTFIKFNSICTAAAISKEEAEVLQDLRNHVFHLKVPEYFTYPSQINHPVIRRLLGTIVLNKDKSVWEKPQPTDPPS